LNIKIQIGARLREEREKVGLSQTELGMIGGVGRNTQASYEKGQQHPTTAYLLLVREKGVDIAYILTGRRTTDDLTPDEAQVFDIYRSLPDGKK